MSKIRRGFTDRCSCYRCDTPTKDELVLEGKDGNNQVIRICESCQLELLTTLHRGVDKE